ncbi:hypothetical protein M4D52_14735 [Paenibacillus lactis]|uniref:hypothetical protein n=1 Tax=Paenibacillus lactis TaxID=228574 RepID=UPI002040E28B|nr:hypothetical protein [Paenibacillus lactis]MCM3494692.1 hypothetical protein [Paenibacillus lactis]
MSILLIFLLVVAGAFLTWLGSKLSYMSIQASRSIASSSAPGELTQQDKIELLAVHMAGFLVVFGILLLLYYLLTKGRQNAKIYNIYALIVQLLFVIVFFIINYAYLFVDYPSNLDSGFPFLTTHSENIE